MGIYIIKSLHSNWIKVGHHLITKRRPSVYYRYINRGFYSVVRPKEIKDRVNFEDLQLIYWFTNLELEDEKKLQIVKYNRSSLISIFQNLISNAIKFRSKNRELLIEIGIEEEGIFYVKDNGIGIDNKFLKRILLPFKRLHS